MRKIIWITGLIAGLLIGLNFFLGNSLSDSNYDRMEVMGFATMFVVFALSLFLGVQRIDKVHYGGHVTFAQAFVASFYIVLIASAVYTIMWEIYFSSHGQEFVDNYLEHLSETMNESGLAPDVIEERIDSQTQVMEAYRDQLLVRVGLTMAEIFPIGLLMALLNGFVQSRLARRRESKV